MMILADAMDTNTMILGIMSIIGTMWGVYFTYKQNAVKAALEASNTKHEEKFDVLEHKASEILRVGNGIMSTQLETTSKALDKVAQLKPNETNTEAARAAKQALDEHLIQQSLTKKE